MPNLKKKKTRKETARRPGGNSGTRRRENSGAAALEKRRRKPRVSWPPRRALLPGEGPAQDPAQPVGPARGACEPGGHTPARPGWGGAAGHLPLPVQSDRTHHTSTTRPRTRRVIKHFRVRRQLFTGNLCTPGKVPGGRAQTGRRPAAEHAAL